VARYGDPCVQIEALPPWRSRVRAGARSVPAASSDMPMPGRLIALCDDDLPDITRHLLSKVMSRLGTPEPLAAALNLIDDSKGRAAVPQGVWESLEGAFVERRRTATALASTRSTPARRTTSARRCSRWQTVTRSGVSPRSSCSPRSKSGALNAVARQANRAIPICRQACPGRRWNRHDVIAPYRPASSQPDRCREVSGRERPAGATRCKAPRQRRHFWQSRQRGFCKLQNLQEVIGSESHPLRQNKLSQIN
jgi:hypothetical protein